MTSRRCSAIAALVDGDPLADISVLQDHDKLDVIMKGGVVHKDAEKAPTT